jgi:hypothetical protein
MHTLQAVGVRARACASAAQGISAGDGMTDASLVPIRRIQVIAVGIQLARSQPSVPYEAGLGNKAGEIWRWVSSITPAPNDNRELGSSLRPARSRDKQPVHIGSSRTPSFVVVKSQRIAIPKTNSPCGASCMPPK